MTRYEVETDVPFPTKQFRRPYAKYPWKQMDIRDSFLANNTKETSLREHVSRVNRTNKYGARFIVRLTQEGLRVWRVA